MPAASSSPVPVLTDGVVRLRAHTPDDVEAIVEQALDAESQRWTAVPRDYTRADGVRFVDRLADQWRSATGTRGWAIETMGDDGPRFAGTIELRFCEPGDTASLGFGLHPMARRTGVMSRAVRLAAAHAFGTGPWGRPLSRLHWRAVVGNWASRRVAWATGFTFHGTIPGSHVDPGDPTAPALGTWNASLARDEPMRPRAPWLEPPVLEEDAIRLRPWRDADLDAVEDRTDPAHWMPPRSVLGREMFSEWLLARRELMAEGRSVEWCVADAASDRALGSAVIFRRDGPVIGDVAELGYQLFPSARGRGAARTAARLAVRHALAPRTRGGLGLRRLVAETAADNVASNRVLERNGFVVYGREHAVDLLADGTYADGLHWELLPRAGPG
ncbi:MAG TPA: GNAT family N-acetyltransferase [Intrasporangium sp.]|uniref:GNAT family N-acetyltransferase n=1 Tax=Intrasporangium sp. TaxID=1925024 RepID=UPI002D778B5D|nr:GNAT family N-acetyltransferase [Intrasporangium sp.]HET7398202.1 GNAT family N-acetyltransferase [Intrasporangium sp.]